MNWTIILLLSSFGAVMGALAVKGFTQKIEPFLWLCFSIATALVISKNIDQKPFLHGLFIGIIWGILNGLFQASFFDSYFANNPSLQKNFDKITFMQPRYFPLITGPVIGAVTGVVLGGLILLFRKIW